MPSLLRRLKPIKHLKGTRLIVVLVAATILLVGTVSVVAYTINLQKKEQPVTEEAQTKPTTLATPKVESEPKPESHVAEEKSDTASGSTQPAPTQANKPATGQIAKPKPQASENPAYVACTQKYNELYVKYNADNASMNAEKNHDLAALDELYTTGFYAQIHPGDTEPYNNWQIDRAELIADYNEQLVNLYNAYALNSSPYRNC